MHPDLYSPQKVGAIWLARRKYAICADEGGLGKSAIAVAAAGVARCRRNLVIATASHALTWRDEIVSWSDPRRKPRTTTADVQVVLTRATRIDPDTEWVVVPNSIVACDRIHQQLIDMSWDLLILDEAHLYSSLNAQRTIAVYGQGAEGGPRSLHHHADRVWRLTASPVRNFNDEMYAHLKVDGKLPKGMDYAAFRNRYTEVRVSKHTSPNGYPFTIVKPVANKNTEELKQLLGPGYLIHRCKRDVIDQLPRIVHTAKTLPAGPQLLRELNAMDVANQPLIQAIKAHEKKVERERLLEAKRNVSPTDALKALKVEKFDLLENGVDAVSRRLMGTLAAKPAAEFIADELRAKSIKKVVIWAWHRDVLKELSDRLAKLKFPNVILFGGLTPTRRYQLVEQFNNDKSTVAFIGQIQAAGEAISLPAASDVYFVEKHYSPSRMAQAIWRTDRVSQRGKAEQLVITDLVLPGELSTRIASILRAKVRDSIIKVMS